MGLVGLTRGHERGRTDTGVAGPCETVVPVADTPRIFRERGGRCRHGRARWAVRKQSECDQASHHRSGQGALVGDSRSPRSPPAVGGLQKPKRFLRVDEREGLAIRHGQDESEGSSRLDRDIEGPAGDDRKLGGGVQRQGHRPFGADECTVPPRGAKISAGQTLLWVEDEADRGGPSPRLQSTDQERLRKEATCDMKNHPLGQRHLGARSGPDRLQSRRAFPIPSPRVDAASDFDREPPRPPAPHQAPKHGLGVEARKA